MSMEHSVAKADKIIDYILSSTVLARTSAFKVLYSNESLICLAIDVVAVPLPRNYVCIQRFNYKSELNYRLFEWLPPCKVNVTLLGTSDQLTKNECKEIQKRTCLLPTASTVDFDTFRKNSFPVDVT